MNLTSKILKELFRLVQTTGSYRSTLNATKVRTRQPLQSVLVLQQLAR